MSAMLALGLLHYGLVAFEPAHFAPLPPVAGVSVSVHGAQSYNHHTNGSTHVHAASPFVVTLVSVLSVTLAACSVAYLRAQAARIEPRANAPPLRPPRLDL